MMRCLIDDEAMWTNVEMVQSQQIVHLCGVP